MEEKNFPSSQNGGSKSKRKKFLFIILGCLLIILVVFFAIGGGFEILKERVQRVVDTYKTQKALKQYEQALDEYYQKFAEDTYGGKTPQETLNMFIEALEKGDIDLAAKYFAMDDNLSRKKWEDGLKQAQQEGRIGQIVEELKRAQSNNKEDSPNYYQFAVFNENRMVKQTIEMEFNQYSGVWKIKSM